MEKEIIETTDSIHLEKLAELKEKMDSEMVSKTEYDKLQKEHSKLLDEYINRRPAPQKQEVKLRRAGDIANDLRNVDSSVSNRDYIELSLEYRDAFLRETGKDPFTDFTMSGPSAPNEDSVEVATVLRTLLDENKNPVHFRNSLNSVLEDDSILMAKLRNRTK